MVLSAVTALAVISLPAQTGRPAVKSYQGWHLQDLQRDSVYGISMEKAYAFVRRIKRKSRTVVVAVIDSGIDTTHEDLRAVLWINPGEIPGNGIDDDHNGYIDDIHGWNFLGGRDGRNVKEDSYEMVRTYHRFKARFDTVTNLSYLQGQDKRWYDQWKVAEISTRAGNTMTVAGLKGLREAYDAALASDRILRLALNRDIYTGTELEAFTADSDERKAAQDNLLGLFRANNMLSADNLHFLQGFEGFLQGETKKMKALTDAPPAFRAEIVQDEETDINDRFYGNADVMAAAPFHGTHVAGIIAAARHNGLGIDGVADNVRIMALRAVPDGDEHDKDIGLAIRYAVDNGALVIKMSFGKACSPDKPWVDEAVRYAEEKGVLLVHAAGNEAANLDTTSNFPAPFFEQGGAVPTNWITVGASGDPSLGGLAAAFSNYGQREVDVFAPGVRIYSTIPGGNTYGDAQGTSMSAPVVSGMAALILSYYPRLSAEQVKYVIETSATRPVEEVINPGNRQKTQLSALCRTGGIVNAEAAIRLASTLRGKRKNNSH